MTQEQATDAAIVAEIDGMMREAGWTPSTLKETCCHAPFARRAGGHWVINGFYGATEHAGAAGPLFPTTDPIEMARKLIAIGERERALRTPPPDAIRPDPDPAPPPPEAAVSIQEPEPEIEHVEEPGGLPGGGELLSDYGEVGEGGWLADPTKALFDALAVSDDAASDEIRNLKADARKRFSELLNVEFAELRRKRNGGQSYDAERYAQIGRLLGLFAALGQ